MVASDRVALVIGVNKYPNLPPTAQLSSPRNDAADVADMLTRQGFKVLKPVLDGSREAIMSAKNEFLEEASGAEIALFYFSGHGVQVGDDQFLMPSDSPRLRSYTALTDSAIFLRQSIMVGLEEAGASTKIIILDCCRDNPFEVQITQALARVGKSLQTKSVGPISGYGAGFFLAFATSPGQVADDGNGERNSPFTSALLTHLKDKAGLSIRDLLDEVKSTVRKNSGDAQVPWVNDSLDASHKKVLARVRPAALPGAGLSPHGTPAPLPAVADSTQPTSLPALIAPTPGATFPMATHDSHHTPLTPVATANTGPDIPPSGFFDLSSLFEGGPFARFNSYSRTEILRRAQQALKAQGLYSSTLDGKPGSGTQRAITALQQQSGNSVTGRLDQATLTTLGLMGIAEMSPPPAPAAAKRSAPTQTQTKPRTSRPSSSPSSRTLSPEEQVRKAVGL